MAVMIFVMCLLHWAYSDSCSIARENSWTELRKEVNDGRIFSKVSWDGGACLGQMIPSENYLLGKFRLRGNIDLDSNSLVLMSEASTTNIEDAINQRVFYILNQGYFDFLSSEIKRDSSRNLIYPYLYLKELPRSQIEFIALKNDNSYQGQSYLQFHNIASNGLDFEFWWLSNESLREIEIILRKRYVLGTHFELAATFQSQSLDSTSSFSKVGVQLTRNTYGFHKYGMIFNQYFVRDVNKFNINETGIKYQWKKTLKLRSPIHQEFTWLLLYGEDFQGAESLQYMSQEWRINQPISWLTPNLIYKFYGGYQYFFQGEIGQWSYFHPKYLDYLRVLPIDQLGSQNYFAHSIEYWWINSNDQGIAIITEFDEWSRAQWQKKWGYGLNWSLYQGKNWYFSGSWVFAWQESFEISRIKVSVVNSF